MITIVIPTYNQAPFIERTLRSVLDQSVRAEVIVVDGGSTDGTVEILRRYEDRLAWWVSEPDRGQTHAINKGMARATGEIRAYLNSDDLYLTGALEAVVQAYEANPEADIFHGGCVTIDADDTRLAKRFHSDIETPEDILDLWGVWFAGRNFVQPEVFWTRRIAERIGPFDETRHYAMDYDYWVRAILAGAKVHRIERDIAAFRLWENQKSTAAQAAADELREIAIRQLRARDVPLPSSTRRRLIGNWAFDETFAKAGGRIAAGGGGAMQRRLAMARVVMRHPELFHSPNFRRHAYKRLRGWLGGVDRPQDLYGNGS